MDSPRPLPTNSSRRSPLLATPSLANSQGQPVVASAHVKSNPRLRVASHYPTPSRHPSFREPPRKHSLGALDQRTSLSAIPPSLRASLRLSSVHDPAMADFADGAVEVGDTVEVPGGMTGTVKFVGVVTGKKGVFAGVELSREFAARGKNDGDAEGTRYFTTTVPGSGIFLPAQRAVRLSSPAASADAFPSTPTTPGVTQFEQRNLRGSSQSPQTPSFSKLGSAARTGAKPNFSQSIGPGVRAPSPQQKTMKPRPSLPRPESPLRKQPSMPNAQTPGRPSAGPGAGLSQSVRGQRPSGISPGPKAGFGVPKTPGAIRSPSRSQSRTEERTSIDADGASQPNFSRSVANGVARPRGASRSQSASNSNDFNHMDAEESTRLKRNLEERDRQLKEQAISLADMETSLAELQAMVAANAKYPTVSTPNGEEIPADIAQLRGLLRDKTDKISSLTAEFDNHRADFRSTIDTLEMASTETERVYEQRVQELLREVQELQERQTDVDGFAQELKRLEELVQELEEGLEDARRGEAEARSEVEFLRGEVERGRTELRREREKAAKALKGATGAVSDATTDSGANASGGPDRSREMAARDDEIRGLKAIIHSLSSSGPDSNGSPAASNRNTLMSTASSGSADHAADREQLSRMRAAMDQLNREKGELRGLIERKNFREEELERELAEVRARAGETDPNSTPRKHSDSVASAKTAIRPGTAHRDPQPPPPQQQQQQQQQQQSQPPSASDTERNRLGLPSFDGAAAAANLGTGRGAFDTSRRGSAMHSPGSATFEDARESPAPLAINKPNGQHGGGGDGSVNGAQQQHQGGIMAQLTGEGPVAGKASGKVDMGKWCALCERDGHDSVDCPLEDEF